MGEDMLDEHDGRDGELAALLALDALPLEEQADAELRFGTWPAEGEATLPLAGAVADQPPADLREGVLAAALRRRPAGRPVGAPELPSAVESYERAVADFRALLAELDETDADLAAHETHGRVRDLVAHLVGVERLNLRWLDPDDDVPDLPDHVAATRATVEELAAVPFGSVVEAWNRAADALLAAARGADPGRAITIHDIPGHLDSLLTMRTFELWAHGMDIAVATGRPVATPDDGRMLLMSSRLMGAVPGALAYRGVRASGRTARFVLTGSAGGCYDVALDGAAVDVPGEPDVTIVGDVVDVCKVAAARLSPSAVDVTVEGDSELATLLLSNIDAFARD